MLTNKIFNQRNHFWLLWFCILIIVFLIHCLTLTVSPPIWQDEVQIIEYGRLFLDPNVDWSVNWDLLNKRPFLNLFYLGCLLQELAFKAANFSIAGPRIFTLIGASVAATTTMGWLLYRQVPGKIAALLGLALLLDPLFVQSYRGDRLESWVIALCFGVCWLLRIAIKNFTKYQLCLINVGLAGSLSAIAMFIWPSAIILYPLILLELSSLLYINLKKQANFQNSLKLLFVFSFSGLITVILLLIPIKDQLPILISNFITYSSNLKSDLNIVTIINFLQSFKNSPILPILAIISLIFYQDKALILTSLLALFIILNSTVYIHRVIYILPYLIALLSGIYSQNKTITFNKYLNKYFKPNLKTVKIIFLVLLLSWATSLSLMIRPIIGLGNTSGRNLDILLDAGKNYIGQGEYKVWDSTFHFYQTGRLLNWKLYHNFRGLEDEKARKNFLEQLDYIIISQSLNNPFYPLIKNSKFKLKESIKIKINNQENKGVIYNITKYLKSQTNYGPYNLYSKF